MKDASKLDYLRHRPFLVIINSIKPPPGWPAERRGWVRHSIVTEHPLIVQRISVNMIRTASVIIDLDRNQVVKNRYKPDMADDEALTHYRSKFPHTIANNAIKGEA